MWTAFKYDRKVCVEILNDTVKVITDLSFKGCTALTRIIIPNSVEFLDAETFSGCSALTDISIPSSVTKIRGSLFCDCTALASISIPNSVTEIGNWAFCGCTALVSIKVDPANPRFDSRGECNAIIETITNEFIAGCKSSVIPNSVKEIGTSAFEGCTGLTSIIVPDSVVYIHRDAFYNCTSFTNVSLSDELWDFLACDFEDYMGLRSATTIIDDDNSSPSAVDLFCEEEYWADLQYDNYLALLESEEDQDDDSEG